MGGREKREGSAALEKVRRRFDAWRRMRKPHARIPEPLWAAAVKMVGRYGLHRTARALQVDYYSLKRRVEEADSEPVRATFVEVTAAASGVGECLVELEGADGAKMRIHLKGGDAPDLIALSRSFWERAAMIQLTPQMRMLVAIEPADFRCGIDGLARLCEAVLRQDPFSGAVFVFRNRRATAIKALVYDGQGFWLCYKRLSSGRFSWWPSADDDSEAAATLTAHQLQVLLSAGDPSGTQAAPAWRAVGAVA